MPTQSVENTNSNEREEKMTAEQNAAVVRRGYEAFNAADVPTLLEVFDENAVWHAPGRSPVAGDYRGRDATLGYLGRLGQETDGNFRAELLHLTADDDGCVVGVQRTVTERNGKRLEVGNCIVFKLTDGRITDVTEHFSDLYAWDEFWS
jgi:hypothetical protein